MSGKPVTKPETTEKSATPVHHRQSGFRETFESIIVAFVLAFLFRTFEAEAFVIPTGSMAPTLLGRHKDLHCPECGQHFTVGASDEVDDDGFLFGEDRRLETAQCPNCRFEFNIKNDLPFKGDRILVNKFSYDFADPERWQVAVFKYPEKPTINYIKRVVGLPGETIKLRQGNVYRKTDSGSWEILRKDDPEKQKLLQILVYDHDHPEKNLLDAGWPARWAGMREDGLPGGVAGWSDDKSGWQADNNDFTVDAQADERWLRYRHFIPHASDWEAALNGRPVLPPQPQLISDYCGYNAYTGQGGGSPDDGAFWVGDLTINATVEVTRVGEKPQLLLELNEGARKYRCRIDVATGNAALSHTVPLNRDEVEETELATAATSLQGSGKYRVTFANVDDRLCLWIDGSLVDFGGKNVYEPYLHSEVQRPVDADLTPVGIAVRDIAVRVSHLLVERDIYYRGEFVSQDSRNDFSSSIPFAEYTGNKDHLQRLLSDPAAWGEEFATHQLEDDPRVSPSSYEFPLNEDEFFMMGDNSPRSKDSRLWSNSRGHEHRHAVPRSALVGKAFYVYWPHGVPFLNDGRGFPVKDHVYLENPDRDSDYPSFTVPFYPQIDRMERIR